MTSAHVIEELAEHHAPVTKQFLTIAGNVRSAGTLLEKLVAAKLHNAIVVNNNRAKVPPGKFNCAISPVL